MTERWADQIDIPYEDLPPWCLEDPEPQDHPSGGPGRPSAAAHHASGALVGRDDGVLPGRGLVGSTLSVGIEGEEEAMPLLLTIEQAAKRLTVGRCTMQQLVLDKEVRSFKIGKLRRIPPEALDEYIARKMRS